jgi:hypothetical protein
MPAAAARIGSRRSGRRCQASVVPFAFHFEPDQHEEDRHQSVRDPVMQVQLAGPRQGWSNLPVQHLLICHGKGRIGRDQCQAGRHDQQQAGIAFLSLPMLW